MPISLLRSVEPFYTTQSGAAYLGDSVALMRHLDDASVDLICTSPPFALLRQKGYGNVASKEYVDWFRPFAEQFKRILKPAGSLVIDLGGTWIKGAPYRSLYHYEFLLELCRPVEEGGSFGFWLAQELYWYNPAKLPTPAEWVTIRRTRVKDAVNTVWWLRPSAVMDERDGKVSNRKVLRPYSAAQEHLMKHGYTPKLRPSEHAISDKFGTNNGGAIPPNLISASNTSSNDRYQRLCREMGVGAHPARFPKALPEFIIGLTTDPGDLVLDPFAGSNTTGEVAQAMGRQYLAFDSEREYLEGSRFRFEELDPPTDEEGVAQTENQKNLAA